MNGAEGQQRFSDEAPSQGWTVANMKGNWQPSFRRDAATNSNPGRALMATSHSLRRAARAAPIRTLLGLTALFRVGALLAWLTAWGGLPATLYAQERSAEKSPTGGSPV